MDVALLDNFEWTSGFRKASAAVYGAIVDSGLEQEVAKSVASQVLGLTRLVNSIGISR